MNRDTMTTTSFYLCPVCNGELVLKEYYFPRTSETHFLSLEFVSLRCSKCNVETKGQDEVEAYSKLYKQMKKT